MILIDFDFRLLHTLPAENRSWVMLYENENLKIVCVCVDASVSHKTIYS